ncbi:MAG: restriction endonuclease subunit S [Microbacterium sp.]|uniref:restriction endonuclease subunit S n=1 Tax=Microbacterium sp. TaxID=51671 RepID=UPI002728FF76|nr:restriction endonuclease subunit S [Microbacterium sp.]MDO8382811.1 restriction endonuclease subunit S [Microbacterium sp.]
MSDSTWRILRLGNVAKTYVPQRDKPEELDGPIPWLRIEDFDGKFLARSKSGQGVSSVTVATMNLRVFPAGTVVTSCSCVMGATAIAANPLVTNQTFIGIVCDESVLERSFLYYWLIAHQAELQGRASGSIQQYLSRDEFRRLRISAPHVEEQRAIADYLDRETAQIDALIAKNQELIILLTERRAAMIVDAVTRGVQIGSTLVDSGVDWIGATPSHWEVRPLRWSARIRTGTTPSGDSVFAEEPGEPWIRPDDLDVSGSASVASRWLSKDGAAQGRPAAAGATLVCTIGATLGKAGRIRHVSYFNQQITSVKWTMDDDYLFWVFSAARKAVARLSVGNTLPILNNDKLATLRIPVPPVEEQSQIVEYIRVETQRIDTALLTARRGVELARERRAALISAAVTGNIDVGVTA